MTSSEWNRKHDSITIRPGKETGERIREAAKAEGISVQAFILKAVEYQMRCKGCYKVAYPKDAVDALAKKAGVKPSEYLKMASPMRVNGQKK